VAAAARSWIPIWSKPALLRAIRATVVAAGLFAFSDQVLGNLQVATFAAFGSFATLVLASFAGSRRDKLVAHLALALAGSAVLTIGTAVTGSTTLAALVTIPVTFAVFFAGALGPNAAAGVNGALLAYVLPAASPGTISMIPDRLAGWWLASACGTAAVLLLSPRPGGDALRASIATLGTELADRIDAALRGGGDALETTIEAKHDLVATFTATPYRPTGLNVRDLALANCVELLEWCTSLVVDMVRERADLREIATVDRELLEASSDALREVASLFATGGGRPDIERLEECRERSLVSLDDLTPERAGFRSAAQVSFHAHTIVLNVLAASADALVACGLRDPDWLVEEGRRLYGGRAGARTRQRVSRVASVLMRDASLRSVWFVNSVRGSIALAAAVAIADLSSVQHGFWVVLGTLSVLRTNAGATGTTALRALTGTAIGFVIGGALLLAIGAGSGALWAALPVAVFVASYTPGTAPFEVGQAAFTVTIAVLFNLLAPVGWKVGVLRIEDVAIGCGVSIVAGALFWPRGITSVVGDDLADAFRSGAAYLSQAIDWAIGSRTAAPDGGIAALDAGLRLDDALRGFLAEQGAKHMEKQELWRLVGGSMRLRLTANAVAGMPHDAAGVEPARAALRGRTQTLTSWFEHLASLVDKPREWDVVAPGAPRFAPEDKVDDRSGSPYGVWLCEHLDHLAEHLEDLVRPAVRVAEIRRRPWWR
jgi:uncharacterized membrane protein YccC